MRKSVAVVILNWNGEHFLREYLPSVIAHTPSDIADVIVADNGSTDCSSSLLEKNFRDVRTLFFAENLGFAEGYNRAVDELKDEYPYVVLLNSDVKVCDDWLTPLFRFMESAPEVGAVQPKILSLSEPFKFEYAGACGGFLDRQGYPYCRGRIFDTIEDDKGQYDSPMKIFWASGAALMVRAEDYIKAGGLDGSFFAHMEEIDLCWRLQLAGKEIWAVPDGKVYHLGGGSLPTSSPQKTYLNFRNNLLMLYKNMPVHVGRATLIRRRLLDTIAWARFVVAGDWKNAKAILRAHSDFRKMRSAYPKKPKINLLNGDVNILFDYFIRARRRFSELQN